MSVSDAKTSFVMLDSGCSRETLSSAALPVLGPVARHTRPGQVRLQHSHIPYWIGLEDWPFPPALLLGSTDITTSIRTPSHAVLCGLTHNVSTASTASPELLLRVPKYHSLSLPSRLKCLCHIPSIFLYTGQLQRTSHFVGLPG